MNKKTILAGILTISSLAIFSQTEELNISNDSLKPENILDEAVVTGTRFEIPVEKSGKSIYKLTSKDIEANAGKSVTDLLNEVPGIQIDGNFSSAGKDQSVYLRGGRGGNVLILIDGVPVNNPSSPDAIYDLRLLALSSIESIEVLNGGLSTLYGSGASAGVINITLKKSEKEKVTGNIETSYGSFETVNVNANVNGKVDKFNYLISGNYIDSENFSEAQEPEGSPVTYDKDPFNKKNALVKLGYNFSKNFDLQILAGYDEIKADYDGGAFVDANNRYNNKLTRIGISPTFKYDKGEVKWNYTYIETDNYLFSASSNPTLFPDYEQNRVGTSIQNDLNQKHTFNKYLTGVWGVYFIESGYKEVHPSQLNPIQYDDTKFLNFDTYASLFYTSTFGLNIHGGARNFSHSSFDSKLVYNLNPSYTFNISNNNKVKLLASYSTSYLTPTSYQLFDVWSGNLDLTPEESTNYEAGGSVYLNNNKIVINAVYFNRLHSNAIKYSFDTYTFVNLKEDGTLQGVDLDITYNISKKHTFKGNYAYVTSENKALLDRIPEHKFGLGYYANINDKFSANIKYNFTGMRSAVTDFTTNDTVELDSYGLLDVYAQYAFLNKNLIVFGALNNVLDTDFIGVYGYTTIGRNFNVGLKYKF